MVSHNEVTIPNVFPCKVILIITRGMQRRTSLFVNNFKILKFDLVPNFKFSMKDNLKKESD